MKQIPSKEQKLTEKDPILSLFAFMLFAYLLQTSIKWSSAAKAGRGPEDKACRQGECGSQHNTQWPAANSGGAQKQRKGNCSEPGFLCSCVMSYMTCTLESQNHRNKTLRKWFNTVNKHIMVEYLRIPCKEWYIPSESWRDSNHPVYEHGK